MSSANSNPWRTPLDVASLVAALLKVAEERSSTIGLALPTPDAPANPSLLGLPRELRPQIFAHCLPPIYCKNSDIWYNQPGLLGFPSNVACSCRCFHEEALKVVEMHMSDRSLICVGRHLSGMKARAGIFFAKYGSMVKTIDLYEIARVDSYYEKVWNLEVMPMLPNLKTCRLRMLEGFEVLVNLDRFPPGLDKPLAEDFFALCERRQHRDYTALRALSEAAVKQNKDFELITYFDFAITGGRAWHLVVNMTSKTFVECCCWYDKTHAAWRENGSLQGRRIKPTKAQRRESAAWASSYPDGRRFEGLREGVSEDGRFSELPKGGRVTSTAKYVLYQTNVSRPQS